MSNICSKQRQGHIRLRLLLKQRRRLGVVACTAVWSKAPRSRFHGCQLAPLSLSQTNLTWRKWWRHVRTNQIFCHFFGASYGRLECQYCKSLFPRFPPSIRIPTAVVAAFFRACPAFQALPLAWGFLMIPALLAACALPLSTSRP